ncbi:MAG: hypothetical protein J5929_06410 [Eubacterium sp.]|nr:hypothetical protein [Eubacterium sp.]
MVYRDKEKEKNIIFEFEQSILGLLIIMIIARTITVCVTAFKSGEAGDGLNASLLIDGISILIRDAAIVFALYTITRILFDIYSESGRKELIKYTNLNNNQIQRSSNPTVNRQVTPVKTFSQKPPVQKQSVNNDKYVCSMCGNLCDSDDVFCGNCGNKVVKG